MDFNSGLSDQQVADLQKRYGLNVFLHHEVTWWRVLLRQFASPFFYLLAGAAVLSMFLGETLSGWIDYLFSTINVGLGFYQEFNAENTIKMLKNLIMPKARVRRNGQEVEIVTRDLVPGDIVLLEPGDIIPADIKFVQTQDLTIDESVLTGESMPVAKQAEAVGLCGTVVQTGNAVGVVTGTGSNTTFGSIARVATQTQRESIFALEIKKFGKFMLFMIVTTLGSVLVLHLLIKGTTVQPIDLILFVVVLAVSIIPEALPVVISFCLARGAVRMARNHVVVRRLSAIEDLGGVEILCTDKTGTLTENKLKVVDIFGDRDKTLTYGVFTNSVLSTDPKINLYSFDDAIAKEANAEKINISQVIRDKYLPYDPALWCVHALVTNESGYVLIIRGAFEKLIERCTDSISGTKDDAIAWGQAQGKQGRRIIAVAARQYSSSLSSQEMTTAQDFTLIGLIAFADPIKSTVAASIDKAKRLGIQIKVLTGDGAEVAGVVAQQIGLIKDAGQVITGADLAKMNELEQSQAINHFAVFARIMPMQKLLIVKKLQETKNVGFLGDGVNDAPALKLAHVALVVENGADVAKDAADIILLKKSLRVIVDGVEEGRKIFLNTVKYLNVTLASNFSNFYTMALISLMIDYLPMLPLQILFLNLLSDLPYISISSDSVDLEDLKAPQNFNFRSILGRATFFGLVGSAFDFMFFALYFNSSHALIQTSWFLFNIQSELAFFYTIRSKKFFLASTCPSALIITLSILSCTVASLAPLTHFGHQIFQFVSPALIDYCKVAGLVGFFFITIECIKYFYYRTGPNSPLR